MRWLLSRNQTRMRLSRSIRFDSDQRMKDRKANDNGLDEKENAVELMISLVSCNRSGHESGGVENAADEVLWP